MRSTPDLQTAEALNESRQSLGNLCHGICAGLPVLDHIPRQSLPCDARGETVLAGCVRQQACALGAFATG